MKTGVKRRHPGNLQLHKLKLSCSTVVTPTILSSRISFCPPRPRLLSSVKSGKPSLHSFSLQLFRLCSQRLAEIQCGPVVRGSLTLESSSLISGPAALLEEGKLGELFQKPVKLTAYNISVGG
ncbi:uncharacterized [Tachysurus ichikawai]